MSRKRDENYLQDKDQMEDVKCPPQHVPWYHWNEELPSHESETSHELKYHHLQKHEYQDEEAITMEEGVPFEEEKEEITAVKPNNLFAQEGTDFGDPDTYGGRPVLPPSRRPDVSAGAHPVENQGRHPPFASNERRPLQYVSRSDLNEELVASHKHNHRHHKHEHHPTVTSSVSAM